MPGGLASPPVLARPGGGVVSRDDGFPAAALDVKFLRDPKVRRLRRTLTDPGDAAAAEHLYLAVVLSSWETGYRVPIDDALAFEDATPDRIAALKLELLDAEGKVPLPVWERWFRPAWDRRERKRAGGREGNRRRWHADRSPVDDLSHTDSDTDSHPESPSVPSHPSVPSGPNSPSHPTARPESDGAARVGNAPRNGRTNGAKSAGIVPSEGPCRVCGGYLIDTEGRVGPGWIEHTAHPPQWTASA